MVELLAILSVSAAGGLRLALPLLVIGLVQGESLWSKVPILARFDPAWVVGVLAAWSGLELFMLTHPWGQRFLMLIQLIFSPAVGAILGMTLAGLTDTPAWLIGVIGGLLALLLQLVQVGWFFRLGKLPHWFIIGQDLLCILLVLFAVHAPKQGGLIALLLLWLAIRSAKDWRQQAYRRRVQR
ncbi:DUF4126 domain-containing protein [Synechococcus sp. PCC 6312]|uniref:DUF4126 domain-containing protein n=1 Tax=Synechococcus sp. (strain ATCC 27167 / PCC 6312) TaxID=195253 RepID=UPI00029F1831|nr:DUF4126 domain-containing protein [Synechococcus sp. PCC 6312]AFY59808.1 hypothetical protein Syn6312_0587 [Synechococcus sp. PCC 6312]